MTVRTLNTSHGFVDELLASVEVSLQHQAVVQVCEHRMLQGDPRLLLQRLEGLHVVVLPVVLEAKADGFLFSVLRGRKEKRVEQRWATAVLFELKMRSHQKRRRKSPDGELRKR